MAIDLILYAAIAAGLVIWLKTILGTRHGEERQRPPMPGSIAGADVVEASLPGAIEAKENDPVIQSINDLAATPGEVYSIANDAARDGMLAIAAADKRFDIKNFLHAAQDAFVMGVESFAEGDLETLEDLLAPDVFKAFKSAIEERNAAENTQITQIHALTQTRVLKAGIEKNKALVTLRFAADQTSYLSDKEGKGVNGHPDETHEMIDIWTFSRPVKSADPRWFVTETHGDFEDDNDIIPDAG